MTGKTTRQAIYDTIARLRQAARRRFMTRPGSAEHDDAIREEVALDHEFDDAVRDDVKRSQD